MESMWSPLSTWELSLRAFTSFHARRSMFSLSSRSGRLRSTSQSIPGCFRVYGIALSTFNSSRLRIYSTDILQISNTHLLPERWLCAKSPENALRNPVQLHQDLFVRVSRRSRSFPSIYSGPIDAISARSHSTRIQSIISCSKILLVQPSRQFR